MAASINFLQRSLPCLKFTLDVQDLFCCFKQRSWFLWAISAALAATKPWRWMIVALIFAMMMMMIIYIYIYILNIYIYIYIFTYIYMNANLDPPTKFISNRSNKFKEILPWSISQMTTKPILINTKIVRSYAMKRSVHFLIWKKKAMENETATWLEFPNRRRATVEQVPRVRRNK